MKTTYRQMIEATEGLGRLLDKQLPAAQAIALARLVKKMNAELDLFQEQRRKIMSVQSDDRTAERIDSTMRMEELLAVEVDIDSDRVELTLDKIDAGTILATEPFVIIHSES